MLNLNHVKAFVAVIDAGGFQEAAKRLAIAQATVSESVQKLERVLGASLIVRSRNGCVASAPGREFLPHARSLLRAAERARSVFERRPLVIGASGNIGTYVLPAVIPGPELQNADPPLDLVIAPNPEIADRLTMGTIDLALMEWWDGRPGFNAVRWRTEHLVVIVAPGHPWGARKSVRREELLGTPLIGGEPGTGTGTLLRQIFGADAAGLQISMTLGSTAAVKEAVKAGWGASLVFASAVADEVRAGTLRSLTLEGAVIEKALYAVLPVDAPDSGAAWRFAHRLASAA